MAEYSYIIGIDPSVTSTGVAWQNIETGRLEHYLIRLGKLRDPERVSLIAQLCGNAVYGTEDALVVIEGHGPQKGNGLVNIALHWMIRAEVRKYGFHCDVMVVPPMTLKKFVADSGRAEKSEVGAHIMRRWGDELNHRVLPEDAAEAFALLQAGKCKAGIGQWLKRDQEALAKCSIVPARVENPTYGFLDAYEIKQKEGVGV
jgi:Holliday junction resolvasome RuvABC endonuclease subunit